MKKMLVMAFATALCLQSFFGLNSCTHTQMAKPSHHIVADDLGHLKKWFLTQWRQPVSSEPSTARVSVWNHDTAFIENNYRNLIPEWRFAKVYYEGAVKFTQVPAFVKDTLQFKIGATDSLSLFAQLSNSDFRQADQSKTFLVIKEVPGEDIYAEAVTFIGDYDYTKADYPRFRDSISYFNLTAFTGVVQYHDKLGKLLRHFEYLRGTLINTIRCTSARGLDPAPDNRVAQPKCYEVLTWERQCITTFTQYGNTTDCREWFLIGSYLIGNCFASDEGNGGGTETAYAPISEDGLDCSSFDFRSTASNWQEAGLTNARVKFRWIGTLKHGESISITLGAPIVIGLPKVRQDGTVYSPGKAAELAAEASDFAHDMTAQLLKALRYKPQDYVIEQTYRKWLNEFINNYGGNASRIGSGSPNIVFKNAQYSFLGNGNCD